MIVDHISLSTTPINLLKASDVIGLGSGFYFGITDGQGGAIFLVTNYHVLTGSPPLEKKAPLGDYITFQFHNSVSNTGDVRTVRMPLFTRNGKPVWITSRAVPDADVAIIPLPSGFWKGCQVFGIERDWANQEMKIRPTTAVTLIGYPHGFYDAKNALPIWKTGTIASEPEIDFEGNPLVLVDVAAFPGMSGSPAFAISSGMYEKAVGYGVSPGIVRQFIGIYASMQMVTKHKFLEQLPQGFGFGIRDYESLQIGHIWKAKLILEMIDTVDMSRYTAEILQNVNWK
jgi:hypothetical protein